ncbi:MAG: 2-amino-4-hydroxy-6-hydroxymethyldihydropteridine diphosphokinase [Gammaproteobacteria bacterium]|nr:2-amino-4-hydroxy-6-hydroxymethyldihydropteridine diphosphokinase [Gammaproteobacteria bacterium]
MRAPVSAYIGLGANLNDPAAQLRAAFAELAQLPDTRVTSQSRCYLSKPLGPKDQPDYLNAVAALETRLGPQALMRHLLAIEARHGRQRSPDSRWGARSLDLDLLVYDALVLHTGELTLPHPELHKRSFVLYPLAELAPDLVIPGHGPVRVLREHCSSPAIRLYEEGAHA